jgi:hypothetical protein
MAKTVFIRTLYTKNSTPKKMREYRIYKFKGQSVPFSQRAVGTRSEIALLAMANKIHPKDLKIIEFREKKSWFRNRGKKSFF